MTNEIIGKLYRLKTGEQYNQRKVAQEIGMTLGVFISRTQGITEWKLTEARNLCKLLGITIEQFIEFCG